MPQEVIEITEREIEVIGVVERGPAGPAGPQADINYTVVSSNTTLQAADLIAANTFGGSFTLTLPANPSAGDAVDIFDYSDTFDTNPLTIARNGERIESIAEDLICNVEGAYFTMIYTGSDRGWQILPRYGTTGGGGGDTTLVTQGDMLYRGAAINERLPIGTAGQVLKVNIGATAPEWGSAPDSIDDYTVVTTSQTLVNGSRTAADTSGGPFTLTLPATPSDGDTVYILDFANTFDTNNLTLARNERNIEGLPEDMVCNVEGSSFKMVYAGLTNGWQMIPFYGISGVSSVTGTAPIVSSGGATPAISISAATTSAAGSMSGADKLKLDGIAASANNYTHPNHSGDVTSVGDGATTIADNAVTNAKLANMAQSTIKGRATASTGDPEDLSASDVRTLLNTDQVTDSRTPLSHTHGNISNTGTIGNVANLPLKTGTNGVIEAGSFSNAAGTFCEGNDARLSDDRDPNVHAASHLPDGADELFDQSLNVADNVGFASVAAETLKDASGAVIINMDTRVIYDGSGTGASDIAFGFGDGVLETALPISFSNDNNQAAANAATTRDNLGLGDAAVEDTTAFAASGSITTSGLTQATARILGRTTASTGAVEEIQIGSGLSLSAGELSANFAAPPAIGNTTPAAITGTTGTFTTLTANNGTLTASAPVLSIEQTWNNAAVAFTGFLVNATETAAASGSMLADFQRGGTSVFSVNRNGIGIAASTYATFSTNAASAVTMGGVWFYNNSLALNAGSILGGNSGVIHLSSTQSIGWSSAEQPISANADLRLFRDAADTLAQRRTTNAQTFNLYGTFTSATNYQRMTIKSVRQTLSALSGASVATTGTFIPDGAVVVGVTTRVATALTGADGYQVGDGTDADRWGDITGTVIGTTSDNANWTAGTIECFTAGGEVTLTAKTANFTAGAIEICVFYLAGQAD